MTKFFDIFENVMSFLFVAPIILAIVHILFV